MDPRTPEEIAVDPLVTGLFNQRDHLGHPLPWSQFSIRDLLSVLCGGSGLSMPLAGNLDTYPPIEWKAVPLGVAYQQLIALSGAE
jgi:hypothetical protein